MLLRQQGDRADPTPSPLGAPRRPSLCFRAAVWRAEHRMHSLGGGSRLRPPMHVGGGGRRLQDPGPRTWPELGRVVAGLTSSRAEMVEAGVLGTLLREGLRAGPGEPSESPSPATSWISRARMATSFTSVWLSLQPTGKKASPVGSSWARCQCWGGRGGQGTLPRPTSPLRWRQESLPRGKCWVRGRDQMYAAPSLA